MKPSQVGPWEPEWKGRPHPRPGRGEVTSFSEEDTSAVGPRPPHMPLFVLDYLLTGYIRYRRGHSSVTSPTWRETVPQSPWEWREAGGPGGGGELDLLVCFAGHHSEARIGNLRWRSGPACTLKIPAQHFSCRTCWGCGGSLVIVVWEVSPGAGRGEQSASRS